MLEQRYVHKNDDFQLFILILYRDYLNSFGNTLTKDSTQTKTYERMTIEYYNSFNETLKENKFKL